MSSEQLNTSILLISPGRARWNKSFNRRFRNTPPTETIKKKIINDQFFLIAKIAAIPNVTNKIISLDPSMETRSIVFTNVADDILSIQDRKSTRLNSSHVAI